MIQRLNIPKPGEHIYIEGPYLQGVYQVYKSLITADMREYKCDAIMVDFHNGPAGIDRKARNISLTTGGDGWFYGTDSKPVEFHELTIVLPTAGRPVFLNFPDIEGMEKTISGIVQWSEINRHKDYGFAILETRYLSDKDPLTVHWDQERAVWTTVRTPQSLKPLDDQPIKYDVEVTFG